MKRRLLLVSGAVALVVAGIAGFRLLKSLSFFQIRRVEVVGATYLSAADVAKALAIPPRTSVFDDTKSLAERARALPGVLQARVSRRLPGTIRVAVREAEAVALSERAGRLALLDAAGRVLPFDPTRPAADLPVADADSAVAGLLSRLRESEPDLFARVQRGAKLRQDVALDLAEGRILFRAGASRGEIRDLGLIADLLDRQGRGWRELDARFLPRIIVRGGGGGGGG